MGYFRCNDCLSLVIFKMRQEATITTKYQVLVLYKYGTLQWHIECLFLKLHNTPDDEK